MDANPRSLKTIFESQCRYLVPLFQRSYVWNETKQWEPLWEDVQAVAERYLNSADHQPHFLGAVVLEQLHNPTGTLDSRQIIDGQQRLTTLQLLIAAARDLAKELGSPTESRFGFLTMNQLVGDQMEELFKVWPTNVDRPHFQQVMQAGSPTQVRILYKAKSDAPSVKHLIPDAYLYFYKQIKQWLNSDGAEARTKRWEVLQNTIYNGLIIVVIDLNLNDNSQVIFETLNARGTPLLAIDLVKNYLLHQAELEHKPIEELHDKYWLPFDANDKFWRQEIRQGRLKRPRIELYLQHYLTLMVGTEVSATNLFVAFRDHVKANKDKDSEIHLAALRHYGDIFKSFYEQPATIREGLFFHRIEVLDTTTVFPFLLHVFDRLSKPQDDDQRRSVLTDLESFLVRRAVCGLTTKNYNKLFLELKQHLESNSVPILTSVREFLLTQKGDSERWPDDEEFYVAWKTEPVYRRFNQSRVRMLLEAIELAMRTGKTESVALPSNLSIEHLLPQGWGQHWPLPDKPDAKEIRESRLHTIGNLTLVTDKLNSTMSNWPWLKKRDYILEHSVLRLNQLFQKTKEWDEDQIIERGKALFEIAKKVWPRSS